MALQEAIRCSLEEAERRRREDEEAALAAQAAAAAADAEEEELRREAEERERQEEAARRARPAAPPPGLAETFRPKQWLTDASISFAYIQLAIAGTGSSWSKLAPLPEKVLLMDPATAFWLTLQEDSAHVEEAKSALKLQDRELVLCPVNDSRDGSRADAGTHWALLVCWDPGRGGGGAGGSRAARGRADSSRDAAGTFGRFSYYDSLGFGTVGSANFKQARTLASRLAGKSVEVSVGSCAMQTNSFDCGVYVLLFSEVVASCFLEARDAGGAAGAAPVWEDRLAALTPADAAERRARYLEASSAGASPVGAVGSAVGALG